MKSVKEWEKAFVLHSRPYTESSLLVELFIEQRGKLTVLAKGARRKQSSQKGNLQPFIPLMIQYSGVGEVKTLTKLEPLSLAIPLYNKALYSAFYLNELLHRVLMAEVDSSELFSFYLLSLQNLAKNIEPEIVLRQFELTLLEFLGYNVDYLHCYASGEPISEGMSYQYQFEKGFIASLIKNSYSFTGEEILALAQKEFNSTSVLQAAKRFTRIALKPYVGSKPFKSRDLFLKL